MTPDTRPIEDNLDEVLGQFSDNEAVLSEMERRGFRRRNTIAAISAKIRDKTLRDAAKGAWIGPGRLADAWDRIRRTDEEKAAEQAEQDRLRSFLSP